MTWILCRDDLRDDSGGWIELEFADGRLASQFYFGPFPPASVRRIHLELPEDIAPPDRTSFSVPLRHVRLFFGSEPLPTGISGIEREFRTNDNWDLDRLVVRSSRGSTLFERRSLRLARHSVVESPVFAARALVPTTSARFLTELRTGSDDLRVDGNPRVEAAVSVVLRGGEEVALETRRSRTQPFVTKEPARGGVFVGSFQSHGAAIGVGDVRGGRALALADITALRVRLVEVFDGIVGTGISFRGDDRWSLAVVRLRVPATPSPRLPGVLGWPQDWRVLTSFFNVGTTLDKRDPVFTSPVIA